MQAFAAGAAQQHDGGEHGAEHGGEPIRDAGDRGVSSGRE
jgi:hypothetical protein